VFCDLAVMVADGGRCVSDIGALGDQVAIVGSRSAVERRRRRRPALLEA